MEDFHFKNIVFVQMSQELCYRLSLYLLINLIFSLCAKKEVKE
jgi:hypothetical protein